MAGAIAQWEGWRRHGPAAVSVVAHGVVGVAVASLLMGASKPLPPPAPEPVMQVALVDDSPPPPMRLPPEEPAPAPVMKPKTPVTGTPAPAAGPPGVQGGPPAVVAAPMDDDGVNLGPPLGLQGLMASDPCTTKAGLKAKDARCAGTNWAAVVKPEDTLLPQNKQDRKKYYAEFQPKCRDWVGCDGGEWISPNGTRSVFDEHGSPMMGGAAGVGGITSVTTRLPPQPDFRDRGFGD